MKSYIVLSNTGIDGSEQINDVGDLLEKVNEYINLGYEPKGGLVHYGNHGLLQTLYRRPTRSAPVKQDKYGELFEGFWKVYPKKKAKQDALKAFTSVAKGMSDTAAQRFAAAIVRDIKHRTEIDQSWQNLQYVPLAATYLRGRRWEDAITPITEADRLSAIPKDDNQLASWAARNNLRPPRPGETFHEYRQYLETTQR